MCLGFDGRTVSSKEASELEKMLDENGVSLSVDHDLAGIYGKTVRYFPVNRLQSWI